MSEEKTALKLDDVVKIAQAKEAVLNSKKEELFYVRRSSKGGSSRPNVDRQKSKFDNRYNLKNFSNKNKQNNYKFTKNTNTNYNLDKYKDYTCNLCKSKGHIRKFCTANPKDFKYFTNVDNIVDHEIVPLYQVTYTNAVGGADFKLKVSINDVDVNADVDTGASISAISRNTYVSYLSKYNLNIDYLKLRSFDGNVFEPLGYFYATVIYQNKKANIKMYVVENASAMCILGKDWLNACEAKIVFCNFLNSVENKINGLMKEFPSVFENKLGRYKFEKIRIEVEEDATPIFMRPCAVPLALKSKVEEELDRMEKEGIISKVEQSDWATSILPIVKKNNKIRLVGNYKMTTNKHMIDDRYPLPLIEEMFAELNGGKVFSKIDMRQAYNQIELTEDSKALLTWNTQRGLYRPNRLMFGIKVATSKFQRIMENIFRGLKGVVIWLDDCLVASESHEKHYETLREVFRRMHEANITVNREKCDLFRNSIEFLGYKVSAEGFRKTEDKIIAIKDAPRPKNISEVRSLVGLIQFYSKFLPKLAQTLAPLYNLLKKNVKFKWTQECETAFERVKECIVSDIVLTHYNPALPLILCTDASEKGISSVLIQKNEKGVEKPLAFWSRTLSDTERRYSTIHREALAIYEATKRHFQYLYGRFFTIRTDAKALTVILGEKNGIPKMAANRLQRWAIYLAQFNYRVEYIRGKENIVSDYLSRAPLEVKYVKTYPSYVNFAEQVEGWPVNLEKVKSETENDEVLQKVLKNLREERWEKPERQKFRPYFEKRNELSEENGILLWGHRIVIPLNLRKLMLKELHTAHLGIEKTKRLARSLMYWPKIDVDIEKMINSCGPCLEMRMMPQKEIAPWKPENEAWSRVHIDHLGPVKNKMFLIMVDAFSKWVEIFEVKTLTAAETIQKLRETMSRYGIMKTLVSDNGSGFSSREMKDFLTKNGVDHVFSPPFSPMSNGQAENGVKNFKSKIKTALEDPKNQGVPIKTLIERFLINYRAAVHITTGKSPAQLFLGRELRTRITQIAENPKKFEEKQIEEKKKIREFEVGDSVLAKNYNRRSNWLLGEILKRVASTVYKVKVKDGRIIIRHVNQLRKREREDRKEREITQERRRQISRRESRQDRMPYLVNEEEDNDANSIEHNAGNQEDVIDNDTIENGTEERVSETDEIEKNERESRAEVESEGESSNEDQNERETKNEDMSEQNSSEKSETEDDDSTSTKSRECVRIDYDKKRNQSSVRDLETKEAESSTESKNCENERGKRNRQVPKNFKDFVTWW